MTTANDIVTYARSWIGAKWRHQGRGHGKDRGIDCAGLLVRTAQHFNLPCEDMSGYRRDPSVQFMQQIKKYTIRTPEIVHGSIGIFSDTVQPCHTGIFAVDGDRITLIHSEALPKGRCHEQLFDVGNPSMRGRLLSVQLFKGVDYGI